MTAIDLNADVGEGFGAWSLGDDAALFGLITSANIACGFSAGDPVTMRRSCELAAARGVSIGAQVGYRDLVGFGRRRMDIAPEDLSADVLYQIGALAAFARAAGSELTYVKPHGALYNTAVTDAGQAAAIVRAIADHDSRLAVLTLPGSMLAGLATEAGITVIAEAFADRAYRPDGSLLPRSEPGAVIHDEALVVARACRLVLQHTVECVDGSVIRVIADSLCLHGDTPGAASLAAATRSALAGAGVEVRSFSSTAT